MNWTKTVKDFGVLLLLALSALALISSIISLISYHGNILSSLISLVRTIGEYVISIGGLLVLAEISENVFAIRNGEKSTDTK